MKSSHLYLAVSIALTACAAGGSGDSNKKDGTGDPSQWTLTATPSRPAVTIQHGGTDTVTVTVTRGGGFTGAIELLINAPPGLVAETSNMVTTGTITSALVSITAGTGSDLVYSIPIAIHAGGTSTEVSSDTSITVNVTRKNGFWTTAPATMSVARSTSSGPTRVTFTKTGFTDDVTASLALFNGAPTGITAVFTPDPIIGDTVTSMTLSVDASVPEGTYSLGVRMNGGGYQGTAPLSLTVTPAPTLTMSFVTNPLIVAKGLTNSTLVNLVRTNLPAGISPTITSVLPTGVTVTFGPPTSFGPTVSLQVTTTAAAVPGSYTLNVTSGGPGVPVVTIPLTLTITP